ncbi:MAG TPA: tetratricopeptide repeat protein, partial [Azospirillaceae bacterium]|nr:tetratricopeptide repeat protein [Azospirillaceae bacterium]
ALAGGRETADALTGLGDALRLLGRHGEAEALHRRAVGLAPGLAEAHNNLARVLEETGRTDAALAEYDRAVALDPGLPTARLNRALLHLGRGRTAEGWEGYAWRFEADRRHPRRRFTIPEWRGGDVSGRRVLVWREQGLGDELMFGALYRALAARCGHLVVECDPRLRGLFARALPGATVRPETDDPRDADLHVPAGSLPRLLRGFPAEPPPAGYLAPLPELALDWLERLAALGPGLKVGFCWRSRTLTTERRRAYSTLDQWGPLFRLPGIDWVSLQYDGGEEELAAAAARFGVRLHRWADADLTGDLETAAALTAGLDLVIAPATSVAEMAGALGVPAWRFGYRDWTWLGTGVRPWFPAQSPVDAGAGGIDGAIARMAARLDALRPHGNRKDLR